MYECYDFIFGLSQHDCECTQDQRPANYNVSESGLYLDELAPINGLVESGECDKNIWTILTNARDEAIKTLVADCNSLLNKKYELKRKNIYAQILGQIRAKNIVSPSMNYALIRIACNPIRGGMMNMKRLGGVFTGNGNVSISLYNNVDGGPIRTNNLFVTPDTWMDIEYEEELPLFSKYVDVLEYYLVYEFDGANLPRDTKIDCGCGSYEPKFDLENPYYYSGINRKSEWSKFVMVGGTEINSLTELDDPDNLPGVTINKMFGLTVEADFICKINEVFCENSLDFQGNPLALSLAFAARYMAGIKVAETILKSPLLNRENMALQEEWEHSIEDWTQKYDEHVSYIMKNVNHTSNDCLKCKDLVELTRQGLFA